MAKAKTPAKSPSKTKNKTPTKSQSKNSSKSKGGNKKKTPARPDGQKKKDRVVKEKTTKTTKTKEKVVKEKTTKPVKDKPGKKPSKDKAKKYKKKDGGGGCFGGEKKKKKPKDKVKKSKSRSRSPSKDSGAKTARSTDSMALKSKHSSLSGKELPGLYQDPLFDIFDSFEPLLGQEKRFFLLYRFLFPQVNFFGGYVMKSFFATNLQ